MGDGTIQAFNDVFLSAYARRLIRVCSEGIRLATPLRLLVQNTVSGREKFTQFFQKLLPEGPRRELNLS